MSNFDDVGDFHEKFDLDNVTHHGEYPRGGVDHELLLYRRTFMAEELEEFTTAMAKGDIVEMFDALLDITYVAMGTAHLLGLPWEDGWEEVQRSNMAKERAAADGSNSKRLSSFDVIKPEGWTPPQIRDLLEAHGWSL